MSKIHILIPDIHATPGKDNTRADWIGELIADVRPDVLVNIGDTWDLPSLASYDKGKKSFQGRTYEKDIEAGLEFTERLFAPMKRRKKKMPYSVFFEGNHEERIRRAVELQPELDGTISYNDLQLKDYYDDVIFYDGNTPGSKTIDGVTYAHFFTSGVMGRPVSGEHPAHTLVTRQFRSCTQGHAHTFDFCVRTAQDGSKIMGLIAGCAVDYKMHWPGETQKLWTTGVAIKHGVEGGQYDLEWVSLDRLKLEYGT